MYQGSREIVTISFMIREAFLLFQKTLDKRGGTIITSPTSQGIRGILILVPVPAVTNLRIGMHVLATQEWQGW